MMKKILFAIFVALILIGCGAPENVERSVVGNETTNETLNSFDSENSVPLTINEFSFTGYAGPKSHTGTFENITAEAIVENQNIKSALVTVQAASVNTGIEALDTHLESEDFFEVEQYPEMRFELTQLSESQAEGTLNFHGVEREITFPITREGERLQTDFLLNIEPFNIQYAALDNEVRIQFDVSLNQ